MARGRGHWAGLSVDQLSREALSLVDEQGLAGLTVRALAERVGVSPMSIYNHFPHKEALLDAVWDQVLASAVTAQTGARTWEDHALGFARRLRAALLAHPNVLPVMLGRAAKTPRAIDMVEETLGCLAECGLPLAQALDLVKTLAMFTMAHTVDVYVTQGEHPVIDPARHPLLAAAATENQAPDTVADARHFDAHIRDFLQGAGRRLD